MVREYFTEVVLATIKFRKQNNVTRNDLMQLMIDLQNNPSTSLTNEEIAGNIYIFFVAAGDTGPNGIMQTLYEFGRHPETFRKAQAEVLEIVAKNNGKLTYDSIQDMHYLDYCFKGRWNFFTTKVLLVLTFFHTFAFEAL